MLLTKALLEQIKASVAILDLVSEHIELKKAGKEFLGKCPFHVDNSASFSVNPENELYYCFGCGEGGDIIRFVQTTEHITFIEAVQHLADRAGIEIAIGRASRPKKISRKQIGIPMPEGFTEHWSGKPIDLQYEPDSPLIKKENLNKQFVDVLLTHGLVPIDYILELSDLCNVPFA